jgi:hypothetical protein
MRWFRHERRQPSGRGPALAGSMDRPKAGSARSTDEVLAEQLRPNLRWATATTTRATRSQDQLPARPARRRAGCGWRSSSSMPASRSVVPVLLGELGHFSLHPQGRLQHFRRFSRLRTNGASRTDSSCIDPNSRGVRSCPVDAAGSRHGNAQRSQSMMAASTTPASLVVWTAGGRLPGFRQVEKCRNWCPRARIRRQAKLPAT